MDRPDEPTEFQPDPQLRLSEGRASGLQIAVIAFACAFILGLMIYGLNQPTSDGGVTASAPPAQETTGAAPQTGENAAPKTETQPQPQPQAQPAQQPVPQQVKPGAAEDDSAR